MTNENAYKLEPTEEEYVSLRHAKFGELPDRVLPKDLVELVETDPQGETREPVEPRREWG
jgi:hypothetical protein